MKKRWKQLQTTRRCICLLFAALFIVSAAMTGTFALQGNAGLTNDFSGTHTDDPPPTPTPPRPPSTISISVVKVWSGDSAGVRPASVQVQLYRNGTAQGQPVTLNSGNSWRHTWSSLSQSGTYTVEELSVPSGYTANVVRSGNTFTITNTYAATDTTTDKITVRKVWSGEAPHPLSVTIALYKDGSEHASIVLSASNNWTHTWTELDRTANWTLREKNIPAGYEATVTATSPGVFVVTNTKKVILPPDENTVLINGQKNWRHGSNAQNAYPTSVTVYIHANGTIVKEVSVTEPTWMYAVAMPKFDDSGKDIKYTISEKKIEGYTSVVSGWNITNVHDSSGTGGPKTGDDSAMWLWFVLMIASAIGIKIALRNVSFRRRKGA